MDEQIGRFRPSNLGIQALILLAAGLASCPHTRKVEGVTVYGRAPKALGDVLLTARLVIEDQYPDSAKSMLAHAVDIIEEPMFPAAMVDPSTQRLRVRDDRPAALLHVYAWHVVPYVLTGDWNGGHKAGGSMLEGSMRNQLLVAFPDTDFLFMEPAGVCPTPPDQRGRR